MLLSPCRKMYQKRPDFLSPCIWFQIVTLQPKFLKMRFLMEYSSLHLLPCLPCAPSCNAVICIWSGLSPLSKFSWPPPRKDSSKAASERLPPLWLYWLRNFAVMRMRGNKARWTGITNQKRVRPEGFEQHLSERRLVSDVSLYQCRRPNKYNIHGRVRPMAKECVKWTIGGTSIMTTATNCIRDSESICF